MLGPGIVTVSTPFAFGYSLHARSLASDRGFAYAALGLSSVELLGFLAMVGTLLFTLLNQLLS